VVARIDRAKYNDKDLIEVKVPVNLPYQTNWQEFERYDGEIQIAGVHYNYVKRKLQNDTLILMCIPNTDKMKLFNARETFFSLVNDMQQNENGKHHPLPVKPVKIFMAGRFCSAARIDFLINSLYLFIVPILSTIYCRFHEKSCGIYLPGNCSCCMQ
jgi:hypothetical protein